MSFTPIGEVLRFLSMYLGSTFEQFEGKVPLGVLFSRRRNIYVSGIGLGAVNYSSVQGKNFIGSQCMNSFTEMHTVNGNTELS